MHLAMQMVGYYFKIMAYLNFIVKNYTNTERQLLAITSSLNYFRTIIYRADIRVQTDHSNLLYNTDSNTSRYQGWKLLLEEYGIILVYIPGEKNMVAENLSRCMMVSDDSPLDQIITKRAQKSHGIGVKLQTDKKGRIR